MIKKSFTLVELIITISVVSILSVFSTGQFSNVNKEARLVKVKSDLKVVRDATVQYMYKSERVPIGKKGLGIYPSDVKLADSEYVMVNLDLLTKAQTLEDDSEIPACITKIPDSARYIKAGVKNKNKQEPSFIYVMDKNFDVYLAEAEKDKDTGYFIYTKIYETKDANVYNPKVKMQYVGNRPILEEPDTNDDIDMDDSVIVGGGDKGDVILPPDISIPGGGDNIEDEKNNNKIFYKNLSVAGFTVFVDMYDIDYSKVKSVNIAVTAGSNKHTIELYPIKATRWFGRVDASNLNNYSGDYNCTVYAVTKEGKRADIGNFKVLVDRTKPEISISKSKNDFYTENPITVTLNAVDPTPTSGIDEVEYRINGDEWVEYDGPFVLNKSDYYEIQARCTDKFGNSSSTVLSIVNDYTKPEIYVTPTKDGAKIDIGVDVDEDDVLWKNGFEAGDASPRLNQNNTPKYGVNGGQSIVTHEKFEGNRAYELLKNDDGNGNIYFHPATSSNTSRMNMSSLSKIVSNNMHLALVYRYKSYGNSVVRSNLDGGWGRSISYYNMTITEDIPKGSRIIKVDKINGIGLGNHVSTDTDPYKIVYVDRVKDIDYENNTITMFNPIKRDLKAGEKLATRPWRQGGSFTTNSTKDTGNEWRLYTNIMKTNNYSDYDLYEYGTGAFLFQNTASNKLYLDNVKMGYAPRIILYKNGVRYNSEAQEYTTAYTDNNIPDKNKPKISEITVESVENNYNIAFNAKDEGTKYIYYTESLTRSGKKNKSKSRSITTTSGIKKYYYVIDNNPNTTNVPTTNSTEDSVINKTLDNGKTWFIHVKAEDNSGNISDVFHKRIN